MYVAAFGDCADRSPVLDEHFAHRTFELDLHTARLRALRHRLRDGAHAADRMTPRALVAVDLAEYVVEQHVGGARRVGTCVVADDSVETIHGLDRVALEPA